MFVSGHPWPGKTGVKATEATAESGSKSLESCPSGSVQGRGELGRGCPRLPPFPHLPPPGPVVRTTEKKPLR